MISGGISLPDAAVLYHGESGMGGRLPAGKGGLPELLEHQIDFDIVPADLLGNLEAFGAYLEENALWIGGRPVQALVVPYSRYLPLTAARFIEKAEEAGFPGTLHRGGPRRGQRRFRGRKRPAHPRAAGL